jgi:hypothetical protein
MGIWQYSRPDGPEQPAKHLMNVQRTPRDVEGAGKFDENRICLLQKMTNWYIKFVICILKLTKRTGPGLKRVHGPEVRLLRGVCLPG